VRGNNGLHKICRQFEALDLGILIEFRAATCKIADHANLLGIAAQSVEQLERAPHHPSRFVENGCDIYFAAVWAPAVRGNRYAEEDVNEAMACIEVRARRRRERETSATRHRQ
jgi:hypothetical protein